MDQAAGNDWAISSHPMLHEFMLVDAIRDIDFSYANSMFNDLDSQMRDGEPEFHSRVKLLRERYVFNNPEAVEYFLRTHRTVAPLLIEAAPQLARAFDNRALLALEVMAEDETPHSICALALWTHDVGAARAALRNFDKTWLADNLQAVNVGIIFDYEPV
jgi:hypothetical protein